MTRRPRQAGFTLVEVLVAVAILALTLGAFVSGGAQYADQARYLHAKTLALWVARNQMVDFRLAQPWPESGREEGRSTMGGQSWEWRAEIEATQDPALRRIDIGIHPIDPTTMRPRDEAIASLTGFISASGGAGPAPTPPAAAPQ